jgi:DNA topoisomerase VI subunit B
MTAPALARNIFKTSRLAEFCSRKELINQTGHSSEEWPLVALKELLDNAIDAAEETGTAPSVTIEVSDAGISIADNGPGIAPKTVADILDYTSRTSSRKAYVSPCRGAQGNALKTVIAMGFALDGERGETVIESRGIAHEIAFSIDRIRQEPKIIRTREDSPVKTGTKITVAWPNSACSILDRARERFLQVAEDYTWINPSLSLTVEWNRDGEKTRRTFAGSGFSWEK